MRKLAILQLIFGGLLFFGGCSYEPSSLPNIVISPQRIAHTATLLRDGRVLVAGGLVPAPGGGEETTVTASALIIDPATGDVQPAGDLAQKRCRHTATLLADGRVLIAGGESRDPYVKALDQAELFDPAQNRFEATVNPMTMARTNHTATLLPSGRVLLAGGDGPFMDMVLSECELFDPASGTFLGIQNMLHNRTGHTATLLDSGQVLIMGGVNWTYSNPDEVELFDPTTPSFRLAQGLYPIPNSFRDSAIKLLSGKVLLLHMDMVSNMAVLFSPATETFKEIPAPKRPRMSATSTLLAEAGEVAIIGGYVPGSGLTPVPEIEKYDPNSGRFVDCGTLLQPRFDHTATRVSDGRILLVGGMGSGRRWLEECELVRIRRW